MGFEAQAENSIEKSNIERAREAAHMILSGRYTTEQIPAAVRQTLLNNYITNEQDIQRLLKEISPLVAEQMSTISEQREAEDTIWDQVARAKKFDNEVLEPLRMEKQRGGDPVD